MVTNPATVVHGANDVLNSTNDALRYDTIRYDRRVYCGLES